MAPAHINGRLLAALRRKIHRSDSMRRTSMPAAGGLFWSSGAQAHLTSLLKPLCLQS